MKTKILLSFAIFFCAAITSNAQINEGRYLLGGSASFSSTKNQQNTSKAEALYTNIQFGKVVKENAVAGIILSYSYSNNSSTNKSDQISAGLFYRKYKTLAKNFYFFGEVDAVYIHATSAYDQLQIGSYGQKSLSNGGAISFIPGISYSVCKRLQMELLMPNLASISYTSGKTENTDPSTTTISTVKSHNFSANANLNSNFLSSFGIGFKFLLGK